MQCNLPLSEKQNSVFRRWLFIAFLLGFSGCVRLLPGEGSTGAMDPINTSYYKPANSYSDYTLYAVTPGRSYSVKRFLVESYLGKIAIDYFDIREKETDSVVVVFPILGGKNKISNYFADALAKLGFECAVIHRTDTFKDASQFADIERVLRENVLRDRIALDFMEDKLGKRRFAGFGMSRGGMNLVLTAGVDDRLQFNVVALAGHDLGRVLQDSQEWRIRSHFRKVATLRMETERETFDFLESTLKTQPSKLAQGMDSDKTLLILAMLDSTVPFEYGLELRKAMGRPETLLLLSGHATSLFYSQFFALPFPGTSYRLLPLPYLEYELARFFARHLEGRTFWWHLPYEILQTPFTFLGSIVSSLAEENEGS